MKKLLILFLAISSLFPARAYELNHPCLLHTETDFEYVREHLSEEPYASALKKLKNSQYCKTSYRPSPVEYLARLDANNWSQLNSRWENAGIAHLWYEGIHTNYTQFMRDAAAAYQLALLYKLENNTAAANAAKNIIVEWSKKNKGLLRNSNGEIIDPNEKLIMFQPYQMAVAAEMLRDYNGWSKTDEFKNVIKWFDDSFYGEAHNHLQLQNDTKGGHYWMNWDLASMTTILALGILADNDKYINEALNYYKGKGGGPGNIIRGVPYLHQDPDSDEILGQGNELGRDQGHNTLCAAVLGTFCQMGLAIGDDLFAYDDYRALKFAEYVAKYNLAKENLYPDPMQNFGSMKAGESDGDFVYSHSSFPFSVYTYGDQGTFYEPSQSSRGQVRPGWDYWTGYANQHGLSSIYSSEMARMIRPDGGGGQYSSNSGGFDQIGFSTLMGYRPFQVTASPDSVKFECIADTWIRQDSPAITNGSSAKVELRKLDVKDDKGENVIGANYHVGLISFKLELPDTPDVDEAVIHIVTERVKGNDVYVYPYGNDFNEKDANWNSERQFAEALEEPIAVFTAKGQKGKAIYDGGITEENWSVEAWTNDIDITDYIASLPKDTKRVNFLFRQDSGEQVCFFSKDNNGQENAFKDTEGATDLSSSMLKPYLKVSFSHEESDENKDPEEDPDEDEEGETSGVISMGQSEKIVKYFSLDGREVQNPLPGELYIVKRANNSEKIIYVE